MEKLHEKFEATFGEKGTSVLFSNFAENTKWIRFFWSENEIKKTGRTS